MRREDSVTIILESDDKALVTHYNDGGIGIHNTGWCIQMNKKQARDLMGRLDEETFQNIPGEEKLCPKIKVA